MKVRISKMFFFDAAHFLPHVADGHKCKRMHGHTYRVELICEGEPEAAGIRRGMVVDYADIAEAWETLHEQLDHRTLNDIAGLENPTTEVLAPWIMSFLSLPSLVAIRVYESSTTWCEVNR